VLQATTRDQVFIPGGTFRMGSDNRYAEEAPPHSAKVGDFRIDRAPVTIRRFRNFVNETGHAALAERKPDAPIDTSASHIEFRCIVRTKPGGL
jgi:formylglycine-generating enzyme required for sulfatase activity